MAPSHSQAEAVQREGVRAEVGAAGPPDKMACQAREERGGVSGGTASGAWTWSVPQRASIKHVSQPWGAGGAFARGAFEE